MNIAHCDIATGEIHGCKKGSFKWLHEKGHIVFNSSAKHSSLIMLKSYLFDLWMILIMFSIVMKSLFSFAVVVWAVYIYITIYEEWWCNQYAKKNLKSYKG